MSTIALSAGLYAWALSVPAVDILGVRGDPATTSNGLLLVLIGWMGVALGSGGAMSWLANPLVVSAWILALVHQRSIAIITAVCAITTCASALVLRDVVGDEAGGPGSEAAIIHFHSGYWLWLASTGVALAAAFLTQAVPKPVREPLAPASPWQDSVAD